MTGALGFPQGLPGAFFWRRKSMERIILSILHSLSVMDIEQIKCAKIAINQETSFKEFHKRGFLALCDIAIDEKRRLQHGKREI